MQGRVCTGKGKNYTRRKCWYSEGGKAGRKKLKINGSGVVGRQGGNGCVERYVWESVRTAIKGSIEEDRKMCLAKKGVSRRTWEAY